MQRYIVGGAVRDALLGLPVQDRDYVVVGATCEDMLAAGFTQVGQDFPVFIHPLTHEEYALARKERKTAPGYHGFVFDTDITVTLAQDLLRRDITINAMAYALDDIGTPVGPLIDPYGGQSDIAQKIFRHISPAFSEDPVRILRVARFAARFHEFSIAPETDLLMQHMVQDGQTDTLVAERTWQELARGLMEQHPERMLAVLHRCGALARIVPELDTRWLSLSDDVLAGGGEDSGCVRNLRAAAQQQAPLPVRFAVLMQSLDMRQQSASDKEMQTVNAGVILKNSLMQLDAVCVRLRVPNVCWHLARIVMREYVNIIQAPLRSPAQLLDTLDACDIWRKQERFEDIIFACTLIQGHVAARSDFAVELKHAYQAASQVNTQHIATQCAVAAAIPLAIREARVAAITAARIK
ncbi:MAG: multifunctional CCA tRNA nucleotidyl transferase/2'3'-cyclic phosphodiesterase/2'nucleotidase/phosphatase [Ottowia sp.]|nr:multifunctional CCA tRNA nucleotidyl transferase/2'3'-cyclic phosphodiesterase/2'nucleotidase/phosphatase [Ottowia sp.]